MGEVIMIVYFVIFIFLVYLVLRFVRAFEKIAEKYQSPRGPA